MASIREAACHTWLHLLLVWGLTGVFMWNHYKIVQSLKEYATDESFIAYSTIRQIGLWYAARTRDGTGFWYIDMLGVYMLFIASIYIVSMTLRKSDVGYLPSALGFPLLSMGVAMGTAIFIDTRLLLNALPTAPVCICRAPSQKTLLHDCQCLIPFHRSQLLRLLTENPHNFTDGELQEVGVKTSTPFSGNNTIEIVDSSFNKTINDLQPWNTFEFSLEFSLVQASIILVLFRLRPFRIYQVEHLEQPTWSFFSVILSNHYYLITALLDALSLVTLVIEQGEYFITNYHLLNAIVGFLFIVITCMAYLTFPAEVNDDAGLSWKLHGFVFRTMAVFLIDIPLLGIRLYMLLASADTFKTDIIFMLFLAKECVMLLLGFMDMCLASPCLVGWTDTEMEMDSSDDSESK